MPTTDRIETGGPAMSVSNDALQYNKPWILQRADPYVYKSPDGLYYFTASVPAYDGISI